MSRLESAFLNCEKLQDHICFLLNKGGLYKVYNGNLPIMAVFHKEDGTLKSVRLYGRSYKGKSLYEVLEKAMCEKGFYALNKKEKSGERT